VSPRFASQVRLLARDRVLACVHASPEPSP
jgi:hypothetical protein